MKVKINPRQLFTQSLDLREYLDISYRDEELSEVDELYQISEYELERIIERFFFISLKLDELPDLIEVDYEGNKHYTEQEVDTLQSGWRKHAEAMARVEFLEGIVELNNKTINKLIETNNKLHEQIFGEEEENEQRD